MPLILNMDFILHVWLRNVPEYATGFCQLVLICSMVSSVSNLLSQVARASGELRKYQSWVSACLFLNFPLSYLVLKLGASPLATMIVNICIQATLLLVRLYLTRPIIGLSIIDFTKNVLLPIIKTTIISAILPCYCAYELNAGWVNFIIICFVSLACSITCILTLGVSANERTYIKGMCKAAIAKFKHR